MIFSFLINVVKNYRSVKMVIPAASMMRIRNPMMKTRKMMMVSITQTIALEILYNPLLVVNRLRRKRMVYPRMIPAAIWSIRIIGVM